MRVSVINSVVHRSTADSLLFVRSLFAAIRREEDLLIDPAGAQVSFNGELTGMWTIAFAQYASDLWLDLSRFIDKPEAQSSYAAMSGKVYEFLSEGEIAPLEAMSDLLSLTFSFFARDVSGRTPFHQLPERWPGPVSGGAGKLLNVLGKATVKASRGGNYLLRDIMQLKRQGATITKINIGAVKYFYFLSFMRAADAESFRSVRRTLDEASRGEGPTRSKSKIEGDGQPLSGSEGRRKAAHAVLFRWDELRLTMVQLLAEIKELPSLTESQDDAAPNEDVLFALDWLDRHGSSLVRGAGGAGVPTEEEPVSLDEELGQRGTCVFTFNHFLLNSDLSSMPRRVYRGEACEVAVHDQQQAVQQAPP